MPQIPPARREPRARRTALGPRLDAPELIFGTEFIVDRSAADGGALLAQAARELGLTFWDTAPPYGSHPHVRAGLKLVPRPTVQIASKTRVAAPEAAYDDLAGLVLDLESEYLDLGFIHYVKPDTWRERLEALPAFVKARDRGLIRAIGLSTHSAAIVELAATIPEIDVICTTYNRDGLWFDQGTPAEMLAAADVARTAGKGVYLIKLLGHGKLCSSPEQVNAALRAAFGVGVADAFNIGMANLEQARANLSLLQEVRP